MNPLLNLPPKERGLRLETLRKLMSEAGVDAILVSDNANLFHNLGRVIAGYGYIPREGAPQYFVRRPVGLHGVGVHYISKPEQIAEHITLSGTLGLELDLMSYSMAERLRKALPGVETVNISSLMRKSRAVKTLYEQQLMRESGVSQERVYRNIPRLYSDGMTDIEFQVEIEKASRLEGCLGQFRISGSSMELYMGNILAGDNADTPSPYDFAMGGEGLNPSLPVGANGTLIRRGQTVMVDINGDYTGYMTDMTRTFCPGDPSELNPVALKAHQLSIDICNACAETARPGVMASELYKLAAGMVENAGLEKYFMGHRQKAGFIGHGLGIEVNELPVIAPKSRDILAEGNAIAIEPKFVIPGTGAVGIENTYLLSSSGMESITNAPVEIRSLS